MGKKFISASASVCLLKFLSSFPSGQVKRKAGSDLSLTAVNVYGAVSSMYNYNGKQLKSAYHGK